MQRRRERRKTTRVEWNTAGRIRFHGVPVTLPCVVHNLSNTGAGITAPNVATLPDEFTLELSRGGVRSRYCRVVWRSKSEVGVTFLAVAPAASKPRPLRSRAAMSAM
jgi:PilZ domain